MKKELTTRCPLSYNLWKV